MQENTKEIFSINKRIFQILDYKGVSRYKFSKKTGISEAVLLNLYKGKNKPSIDFIEKLLLYYTEIDLNWLLTGEGEMFKEEKAGKAQKKSIATNKGCEFCKLKDQLIAAQSQTIELLEEKLSKCCPQQEECEKNESKAG
jgi:transcriptional regulator with XRE-family HTH domain